ncbi:MAG: N-acetyl-gamma-glutamyl-phosphate reductase [Bacteroidota bacterium]
MIKTGIIGAAGYTAGELIRILIRHPEVEIVFAQSNSQAGKKIFEVHEDLVGEIELEFVKELSTDVEVLFICSGHGKAKPIMESHNFGEEVKIIDLSRDFRLKSSEHNFIYGLPELNRNEIKETSRLANPGCFATCIQLGLLPLAASGKLNEEVHIHAITGSTGAGQNPVATTHFSWRNNNLSIYKAFNHQHLGEIHQSLAQLQKGFDKDLNFLPMRGDYPRGIYASMYLKSDLSLEEAEEMYQKYYASHPFTHLTPKNPHLKQVVNTNKALIHVEKHGEKLLIISMIDNLLKGASGQAVQNMNLMFGLEETLGLQLKALVF